MKSVLLAPLLFVCCSVPVHGQQGRILFSTDVEVDSESRQHKVLAPAEHRSRVAQLGSGNAMDVSAPLTLHLFEDVSYTVQLERDPRTTVEGLEVWKGKVADSRFDHIPHYINTVFVINRRTGKLVANIETQEGFFQILPTEETGSYRIRDCKSFENSMCKYLDQFDSEQSKAGGRSVCGSPCYDEVDGDGKYFLDVFAGYSEEAAAVAGDLDAHAQANIETVNMGLANSMVDMVYLRLVGTATTPDNPGIVTSVLSDAWTWFAPEIAQLAPDFIAIFQTPTDAPGSAGGWGHMPGHTSVNGVEWGTVFRHEFGHNVGGAHCYPDNESHRNGYDNGNWRTHLCGNDVNFYSTPLVSDNLGNPIGDVAEADMVRAFEESAAAMATYAMHRVPLFEGDPCVNQMCLPDHWGGQIENITRVQFNTIDNLQSEPGWTCSSITGYSDFTDLSTDVIRGETHTLTVHSNYSWAESLLWAYIDWDNDGILTSSEQVADLTGNGPWSATVNVPSDAALAPVRLRVRLLYGAGSTSDPCGGTGYSSGETEDYTVNILDGLPTSIADVNAQGGLEAGFTAFPNPAHGIVTLKLNNVSAGMVTVNIINMVGQQVFTRNEQVLEDNGQMALDLSGIARGMYTCELHHPTHGVMVGRLVVQ